MNDLHKFLRSVLLVLDNASAPFPVKEQWNICVLIHTNLSRITIKRKQNNVLQKLCVCVYVPRCTLHPPVGWLNGPFVPILQVVTQKDTTCNTANHSEGCLSLHASVIQVLACVPEYIRPQADLAWLIDEGILRTMTQQSSTNHLAVCNLYLSKINSCFSILVHDVSFRRLLVKTFHTHFTHCGQVMPYPMAGCLTAQNNDLKGCWLIIHLGINLRIIPQKVPMNLICNLCVEITPNELPGLRASGT